MDVWEKCLIKVLNKYSAIDETKILKNLSPVTCEEKYLMWWASQYAVPFFNDQWSSETKRDLVLRFRYIHRVRGTLRGLKDILSLFGVVTEVEEYPENQNCVFFVTVYINDNNWSVGTRAEAQINKIIDWVRPVSRHYKLTVKYRVVTRPLLYSLAGTTGYKRFVGDFRGLV